MAIHCLTVIVNPQGGKKRGLKVLDAVRPVFENAGIDLTVHVTQRSGHASEIARTLTPDSCDAICVIGGDGTFHEVANARMLSDVARSLPLSIIPAGTGNNTAEHLQCGDPIEAARRIVAGQPLPLDVIRVTLKDQVVYCLDLVGWGAVADINLNAEKLRWLGPSRYSAATLWQILRPRLRRAALTLDGQLFDDEYLFVVACNPKFAGPGMLLAPHAEIGDGKVDVLVVRNASRRELLRMFSSVFDGSHLSLKFVEYRQVRTFSIESSTYDALDLDGEMKGHSPLSAEVLPAALSILA